MHFHARFSFYQRFNNRIFMTENHVLSDYWDSKSFETENFNVGSAS